MKILTCVGIGMKRGLVRKNGMEMRLLDLVMLTKLSKF